MERLNKGVTSQILDTLRNKFGAPDMSSSSLENAADCVSSGAEALDAPALLSRSAIARGAQSFSYDAGAQVPDNADVEGRTRDIRRRLQSAQEENLSLYQSLLDLETEYNCALQTSIRDKQRLIETEKRYQVLARQKSEERERDIRHVLETSVPINSPTD